MLPTFFFVGLLAIEWLEIANAEVITVGAQDPRIGVDRYFELDVLTPGCKANYWSLVVGATVSFNFTGISVGVIGSTDAFGGIYDIFIDSVLEGTVDRFADSAKSQCGLVMFERINMTNIPHALRMVFQGNSPQMLPGDRGFMDIIEIRYTIPDIPTTTSSSFSSTPSSSIPSSSTSKSIAEPTSTPNPVNTANSSSLLNEKANILTGAIAGSVIGGIFGLGLISGLGWFFIFRKRLERKSSRFSLDLGGDDGETAMPYIPPSNTVSSIPGAYPTMPPVPIYESEPLPWQGANSATRSRGVRSLMQHGGSTSVRDSVTYPPEMSTSSLQPPSILGASAGEPFTRASPSAGPRTTDLPLLEDDVQRIARAILAQSSSSRIGLVPHGYQ